MRPSSPRTSGSWATIVIRRFAGSGEVTSDAGRPAGLALFAISILPFGRRLHIPCQEKFATTQDPHGPNAAPPRIPPPRPEHTPRRGVRFSAHRLSDADGSPGGEHGAASERSPRPSD